MLILTYYKINHFDLSFHLYLKFWVQNIQTEPYKKQISTGFKIKKKIDQNIKESNGNYTTSLNF